MANEILASLDDINTHLPDDKAKVADVDDDLFQIDVSRMVKGYLGNTFTAVTLATWISPTATPGVIRGVAGKLIAALHYRKLYSEDIVDHSDSKGYAQRLYNEAMASLESVRSGALVLLDLPPGIDPTYGGELTSNDFWPNNSTNGPVFTMDKFD